MCLFLCWQSRPSSQHSNGEDGQQQLGTTKGVVGAKVSQLAHLFQSRSKEEASTTQIAVPPVSPTASVPFPVVAPPTATVVGGRTKPSSRSETDKETHQDVKEKMMTTTLLTFFPIYLF